jgi:CspA family cold shock protein
MFFASKAAVKFDGTPTKSASPRWCFFQSDLQTRERQPADWTIGKLMVTGTVKWYDERRGYGFIEPDDGGECLFVRRSEARGNLFEALRDDQRAAFEVEKGPEGNRAISVEIR